MYGNVVQNVIDACQWDTTNLLVVSENVFDPFIYYSHIVPLLVSLTIGFFVLYKKPKELLTRILFFITALFSVWVFFDLILWATNRPDYTIFFWSFINLIEPLIYASSLYFVQVFIKNKDTSLKNKIIIFIPILPLVLLLHTSFTLLGYNLSNCDREAVEGPLTHYSYFVEVFYTLWIVVFAMESFRKIKDSVKRQQIILITIGIMLFLLTFSFGNIIGSITDDWRLPQWSLFGMPVFLAFLSYLIVKYKVFDIKLIATQALAITISILVGSQFFFIRTSGNKILNLVTFAITVLAGFFLVRSVRREIKSKEKEVMISNELKIANAQQAEITSFITHQIRGSFTDTLAGLEALKDGDFGKLSPEVNDVVLTLYGVEKKARNELETFLRAQKVGNKTVEYVKKPYDIKESVSQIINQAKVRAEAKGLKYNVNINVDQHIIVGDQVYLDQVFSNLIDNAIHYTPQGNIDISLVCEKDGDGKDVIRFSVKDSGVGITDEDKKVLFTKYGHGKHSRQVNTDSSGLGLFIAKNIVDAHGGKIWAESEGGGKGSTFYVELPEGK